MAEYKPLILKDGRTQVLTPPDTIGGFAIAEVPTDPVAPATNSAWVLRQGLALGEPVGLLLALTSPGFKYFFSYKTISGAVVRSELT